MWILFLNDDGTVASHEKISDTEGGFEGPLCDGDAFGTVGSLGDLDGDGITDLAVGAQNSDDGDEDGCDDTGTGTGAVWILFLSFEYPFIRGDANGDGKVDALSDALSLLAWGFTDGDEPPCRDAADVDDSGAIRPLVDAIMLLAYGFQEGPEPPDPGPDTCGRDPVDDDVTCLTQSCSDKEQP